VACSRDTAPYFHAVPYYFAVALQEKLDVPVGLVTPILGGTRIESWMSLPALHTVPAFGDAATTTLTPFTGSPACLFNGMIAPLTALRIRGALWYQGESNVGLPHYAELFQALIADWRTAFGQPELPFYFVQIAPYRGYGRTTKAAELREAQAAALQLPHTGMALTLDVSDVTNIHPKNKRDVGRRLAWQALAKAYGCKDVVADGPTMVAVAVIEGRLQVTFREVGGGLVTRDGKPPTCFEIAGADGTFGPAAAAIAGDAVVVSSPTVPQPMAVRFAWGAADVPNLMSKNGLPVAQFKATAP